MPHLLVTMPVRNGEDTLQAAVASTLRALPRDGLLAVYSDGSTDRTEEVLASIRHPRLRYVVASESRGSGYARQALLERYDSEVVGNMDADDVCLPWRFRHQLRLLEHHNDAVFGSVVKFSDKRHWRPAVPVSMQPSETALSLLMMNVLVHSTFTARREALVNSGGYRTLRFAQDYDLWLRMAAQGYRIRQSPLVVAAYRLSPTQATQTPDYMSVVRQDETLTSAYGALMHKLSADGLHRFPRATSRLPDPAVDPEPLGRWLDRAVTSTSLAFRTYYRLALRSRGVSWRHSSWRFDLR